MLHTFKLPLSLPQNDQPLTVRTRTNASKTECEGTLSMPPTLSIQAAALSHKMSSPSQSPLASSVSSKAHATAATGARCPLNVLTSSGLPEASAGLDQSSCDGK